MTTDTWIGVGIGFMLSFPAAFMVFALMHAAGRSSRAEEISEWERRNRK